MKLFISTAHVVVRSKIIKVSIIINADSGWNRILVIDRTRSKMLYNNKYPLRWDTGKCFTDDMSLNTRRYLSLKTPMEI